MEEDRAAGSLDAGFLIVIKDQENIVDVIFPVQLFVTMSKWQADPAVVQSAGGRVTPGGIAFD